MTIINEHLTEYKFAVPTWGNRINLFEFLNSQLRPESPWSISDEYPLFYSENNFENLRIATVGDQIVAHAGVRFFIAKTHFGLVKIAAVGSVVTHPEHRSKGLSQNLIQQLMDKAWQEGADIAVLWTDLHDFYKKIGFELAGTELTVELSSQFKVASDPSLKYLLDQKFSSEALLKGFLKHSVNSLRKASDIESYLRIPNSRIHSVWDQNHKLLAYAIEGKGADLQDYVHEWGGETTPLLSLLSKVNTNRSRHLKILAAPHHQNFLKNLRAQGSEEFVGCLCMMKWIDPDRMFRKINLYAAQKGMKNFFVSRQDDLFKIQVNGQVFQTDQGSDFIPLIFGPTTAQHFGTFDSATAAELEKVFPLPFWIWGWDSV